MHDSLNVYDGASKEYPKIGMYCGTKMPPTLKSTGNQMSLKFKTDGADVASGYAFSYMISTKGEFYVCFYILLGLKGT